MDVRHAPFVCRLVTMRVMRFLLLPSVLLVGAASVWAQVPAVTGKIQTAFTQRYIDYVVGTGRLAEPGKVYIVHYTGYLKDGTKFDSTKDRGKPFGFEQGKKQVIAGWEAGFEGMHVGGKRRLMIPYQLGYGINGRGKIPPKAELIFDIELIDVRDSMPR